MIIDARALEPGTDVEADVCIVGAGVAGLTLARELIGSGQRVSILESGGREPDPATQLLDAGENSGFPYYPLHTARSRSLGGSSTLWHVPLGADDVGARMRPLDPIDFEEREWVPHSGWPFGRDHLDGYYERAQAVCGIQPATFDVRDWQQRSDPTQQIVNGPDVETILYKFCRRALFAEAYPNEIASAPNVTMYVHATVQEVEVNEAADHVARLRVATLRGNQFFVRARCFVLALGGIETPRLLLLSNQRHPAGLGNQHDTVGRFFMEHLHLWSGMMVPVEDGLAARTSLYNDIQVIGGVAVIGKLALTDRVLRREQLLNQNVQLAWRPRPDPFTYRRLNPAPFASLKALTGERRDNEWRSHLRTVAEGWHDLATAAFRRISGAPPTQPVAIFANMAEQVPNPESRVTLGDEQDAFGLRRARLDWRITAQDIQSVRRTQHIMASALERAGWGRFYSELQDDAPPPGTHGGYHHMGTTRMHTDPRRGVVDADSRMHGIENLYIAGPSVFPTGGYANPVLTVVALTLRLADHVKRVLARQVAAA